MDPLLFRVLAQQAAVARVKGARTWQRPADQPFMLLDQTHVTPTARYLSHYPDTCTRWRAWLHTAQSAGEGTPAQGLLRGLATAATTTADSTWWQRLVPQMTSLEREHALMCGALWFRRLDQDVWATEGLGPLVYPTALPWPSALCLLVVAYEMLGAMTHPDAPVILQVFVLRTPVPGTPQSLAGHWPPATTREFRFMRAATTEAEAIVHRHAEEAHDTHVRADTLNTLDSRQDQAFRETVDADTTPLVVYDLVYLETCLASRAVWLPVNLTAWVGGSFVLPSPPSVSLQ